MVHALRFITIEAFYTYSRRLFMCYVHLVPYLPICVCFCSFASHYVSLLWRTLNQYEYLHPLIKPYSVLQTKADGSVSVLHSDKSWYLKYRVVRVASLFEPERNTGFLISLAQFTTWLQLFSHNNTMDGFMLSLWIWFFRFSCYLRHAMSHHIRNSQFHIDF